MASRSAPVTGAFPPFGGSLPFGALPSAIDVLGDERREIRANQTLYQSRDYPKHETNPRRVHIHAMLHPTS
jgi:hypothetical protein